MGLKLPDAFLWLSFSGLARLALMEALLVDSIGFGMGLILPCALGLQVDEADSPFVTTDCTEIVLVKPYPSYLHDFVTLIN